MPSSSFEIPLPYLFILNLENSIVALLRSVIIAQTYPIYVVLMYCCKVSIEHHCTINERVEPIPSLYWRVLIEESLCSMKYHRIGIVYLIYNAVCWRSKFLTSCRFSSIRGTFETKNIRTIPNRTRACLLSSFSCCWWAAVAWGPIRLLRRLKAQ